MQYITPRFIYYTTVFLTGAGVLIFEVAAVRMLAPYFGASLYVLSSVLTVILAALSLGYFFGGRLADRMPHFTPLYLIIGSAGILMLLLLLASEFLIPVFAPLLTIVSGPLVFSLVFFLVPAFLLGIDSPFVIRILTEETTSHVEQGSIVGSVFFWSTVGSIVGSLSAGFWLIPFLGLTLTIAATATALIVWSCVALMYLYTTNKNLELVFISKANLWLIVLGAIVLTAVFWMQLLTLTVPSSPMITTLYKSDSYYSNIHVFEQTIGDTRYRFLKNDSNNSSAIIPGNTDLVFGYAQMIQVAEDMVPDAKNFLLLGGGAYTIPRYLHSKYPELTIDITEIDAELYPLSKMYFELQTTPKITNYPSDARVFLQSTTTTYDMFFSDVMNSGHFIPPHLTTQEFYTALKDNLSLDGVGLINIIGSVNNPAPALTDSLIMTIASVFPNHTIVPIRGNDSTAIQNIIVIVRHEGQPITISDQEYTTDFGQTKMAVKDHLFPVSRLHTEAPILTDDKNPTERLLADQIRFHKR